MNALGEHVIVKLPPKREKTAGGVHVGVTDQKKMVGRIVSVGAQAEIGLKGTAYKLESLPGSYVVFDENGSFPIELDPTKAPDLVAMNYSACVAVLTPEEAEDLGIPKVK